MTFDLRTAEKYLELVISDTGEGIEPEFLPFIFDRFRQADSSSKRVHGGLGLGLSIVRSLVEMHGGEIHATSRGKGKGSTFTLRLPLIAASDPDEKANVQQGQSAKVLPFGWKQQGLLR